MKWLVFLAFIFSTVGQAKQRYLITVSSDFDHKKFAKENPKTKIIDRLDKLGMLVVEQDEDIIMQRNATVKTIERDAQFFTQAAQQNAPWGLDRIDQRDGLNTFYFFEKTGKGVNAYVVDSGIRASHIDFGKRVLPGFAATGKDTDDCNGHGTHVAGTIAGGWSGVAKEANIIPVRVFGCNGTTSTSTIIKGLEWILKNVKYPAVVNMSLGGGISPTLDTAIAALYDANITVVVAAGNESSDACNSSPARNEKAITVAASDNKDSRASFSNWGDCVDVFAPGTNIRSAWYTSDKAGATLNGTSMASPHVAGVVALYLEDNPHAMSAEVYEKVILQRSTKDAIKNVAGSPNYLIYSNL